MTDLSPKRAGQEESEAREYAVLIRTGMTNTKWGELNRAIIERWSASALMRVKRRAWALVESGEEPHGQ